MLFEVNLHITTTKFSGHRAVKLLGCYGRHLCMKRGYKQTSRMW